MEKVNPSRAEKVRRDKQRKMQAYVKELREKGTDETTIKRLKRKFKNNDHKSSSGFTDEEIECKDCGNMFLFSAREQAFYEKKGYSAMVRCKSCIQSKKERMALFDKKGITSID